MPRRKKLEDIKRKIGVDPVYGSELVQKFINVVMERGKKSIARNIVYGALDMVGKKVGGDKAKTLELFNRAFMQIVPAVEVRARRVGGSVYQIPREVPQGRGRSLGFRWLLDSSRVRTGKTMSIRLANEILDAYEGRGAAIKKRADVHKMAESNRAFSHYAW